MNPNNPFYSDDIPDEAIDWTGLKGQVEAKQQLKEYTPSNPWKSPLWVVCQHVLGYVPAALHNPLEEVPLPLAQQLQDSFTKQQLQEILKLKGVPNYRLYTNKRLMSIRIAALYDEVNGLSPDAPITDGQIMAVWHTHFNQAKKNFDADPDTELSEGLYEVCQDGSHMLFVIEEHGHLLPY
jgi:hypothetical protein